MTSLKAYVLSVFPLPKAGPRAGKRRTPSSELLTFRRTKICYVQNKLNWARRRRVALVGCLSRRRTDVGGMSVKKSDRRWRDVCQDVGQTLEGCLSRSRTDVGGMSVKKSDRRWRDVCQEVGQTLEGCLSRSRTDAGGMSVKKSDRRELHKGKRAPANGKARQPLAESWFRPHRKCVPGHLLQ